MFFSFVSNATAPFCLVVQIFILPNSWGSLQLSRIVCMLQLFIALPGCISGNSSGGKMDSFRLVTVTRETDFYMEYPKPDFVPQSLAHWSLDSNGPLLDHGFPHGFGPQKPGSRS